MIKVQDRITIFNTKQLKEMLNLKQNIIILLFVIFVVIMSFINKDFLTVRNTMNILRQVSVLGILTCGISWMLIHGSFDLSAGSIVSFTCVSSVWLLLKGTSTPMTIILILLLGGLCGAVNGLFVGILKGNSMICTLGTQVVFQGFALFATQGKYLIAPADSSFKVVGRGNIYGFPVSAIVFILLMLVMNAILTKTTFGRKLYAMGTNSTAASLCGINIRMFRFLVYILVGMIAAMAGIVAASRVMTGSHFVGLGMEFDAVIASVLGGVNLFGGTGSVAKAFLGAIILATLANAQTLMGVPSYFQLVVQGFILVIIVAVDLNTKERGK